MIDFSPGGVFSIDCIGGGLSEPEDWGFGEGRRSSVGLAWAIRWRMLYRGVDVLSATISWIKGPDSSFITGEKRMHLTIHIQPEWKNSYDWPGGKEFLEGKGSIRSALIDIMKDFYLSETYKTLSS